MKKIIFVIIITILSIINISSLKADCSTDIKEIRNSVDSIYLVNYDVDKGFYFQIKTFPIDDRFYIKIKGDGKEEIKYFKDAVDQEINVERYYIYEEVEYTIEIYSNMTECKDELINKIKIITPEYNRYRDLEVCTLNREYQLCMPFENTSKINKEEFIKEVKEYEKEKNKTSQEKIIEAVKKYYIYVLVPFVSIGSIYTYKIIVLIKKKKKNLI